MINLNVYSKLKMSQEQICFEDWVIGTNYFYKINKRILTTLL